MGLVIALSISCGTLMKCFLYYNISQEKLSDRPINVLILIEQIMHHIFYLATGMGMLAKVKDVDLKQGSQTLNNSQAALRRKMSQRAAD